MLNLKTKTSWDCFGFKNKIIYKITVSNVYILSLLNKKVQLVFYLLELFKIVYCINI